MGHPAENILGASLARCWVPVRAVLGHRFDQSTGTDSTRSQASSPQVTALRGGACRRRPSPCPGTCIDLTSHSDSAAVDGTGHRRRAGESAVVSLKEMSSRGTCARGHRHPHTHTLTLSLSFSQFRRAIRNHPKFLFSHFRPSLKFEKFEFES